MTEKWIPTDEELDALLDAQPQFDPEAVKARTLAAVAGQEPPEKYRRGKFFLRCTLIAAALCLLSATALAAVDTATGGRITAALGIRTAAEPATEPETAVVEEVVQPEPEPAPEPVKKEPEEPPEEPPELDRQVADSLGIRQEQAKSLRPAVQEVERTAEEQDVRMTVLQTLGDPSCLYVKLRFDFPEEVPAEDYLEFENMDVDFGNSGSYSYQWTVLERTGSSITYLLTVWGSDLELLDGNTATVTVENYGHDHQYADDEILQLAGEEGKPYTTIIAPDGTMRWDVSDSDTAALPPQTEVIVSNGFTISRREDGSRVVTYDGAHGDRMTTLYLAPDFDAEVAGKWEQSWELSYEDLSLRWTGASELFGPVLTLTDIRLSPLSWEMTFTARELEGENLAFSLLPESGWNARLRHRDGSLTEFPMRRGSGGYSQERDPQDITILIETITTMNRFDRPVDISDVTAIVIDGTEYPLTGN